MTTLPGLKNTGLYGEIPPLSDMVPINSVIFVTHTLAQLAIIQLHNSLATDIPGSYDTCLTAAREILRLTQHLTPADYARTTMEVVLSVSRAIFEFSCHLYPYSCASSSRLTLDADESSPLQSADSHPNFPSMSLTNDAALPHPIFAIT